jgi:hypothetical protein
MVECIPDDNAGGEFTIRSNNQPNFVLSIFEVSKGAGAASLRGKC